MPHYSKELAAIRERLALLEEAELGACQHLPRIEALEQLLNEKPSDQLVVDKKDQAKAKLPKKKQAKVPPYDC